MKVNNVRTCVGRTSAEGALNTRRANFHYAVVIRGAPNKTKEEKKNDYF
jgi:hypothetical protein